MPSSKPLLSPMVRRVLLIGVGPTLGAVIVAYVVGMFTSQEFHASLTFEVPDRPAIVWAAIRDVRKLPLSGSYCRQVIVPSGPEPATRWQEDMGESLVNVQTVKSVAPSHWEITLTDSVMPMTSQWTYDLTPTAKGCQVIINQRGTVADGGWDVPFFRFLIVTFGGVQSGLDAYGQALVNALRVRSLPSATAATGSDVHP